MVATLPDWMTLAFKECWPLECMEFKDNFVEVPEFSMSFPLHWIAFDRRNKIVVSFVCSVSRRTNVKDITRRRQVEPMIPFTPSVLLHQELLRTKTR